MSGFLPARRLFALITEWLADCKEAFRGAIPAASAALTCAVVLTSCLTSAPAAVPQPGAWPEVRFAVLSDPHLFDASLSDRGPAFTREMSGGAKLFAESGEILQDTVSRIAREAPRFLIVPGDLTKDGERTSHERAAALLGRLTAAGTAVYVVPGNHDVANPHAVRYAGDSVSRVASVTPDEFAAIYRECGYGVAFSRDPASLSYAAEPMPGLWLLAIDSCRYRENSAYPLSGGRIGRATLEWMEGRLQEARKRGVLVICFLHHGVLERFRGQGVFMGSSILGNHGEAAGLLERNGVHLVFTGHGHAQDITRDPAGGGARFLFDVETGSTATWPNPWRLVDVSPEGRVRIRSFSAAAGDFADFSAYSESRLRRALEEEASAALRRAAVPAGDARLIAGQAADAAEAHFRGDEPGGSAAGKSAPPGRDARIRLGQWGSHIAEFLGPIFTALVTDLDPPDNDVTLFLSDGSWTSEGNGPQTRPAAGD